MRNNLVIILLSVRPHPNHPICLQRKCSQRVVSKEVILVSNAPVWHTCFHSRSSEPNTMSCFTTRRRMSSGASREYMFPSLLSLLSFIFSPSPLSIALQIQDYLKITSICYQLVSTYS